MSETVHYAGKLNLIAKGEKEAINFADQLLATQQLPSYCSNKLELLLDDDKYEFSGENLYEVISKEKLAEGDIFHMAPTENPNEFDFRVQYYNGGCSFGEAIEEAEKELNKRG